MNRMVSSTSVVIWITLITMAVMVDPLMPR